MSSRTWVGILVCTEAGQPVGFELALERTLFCRQTPLRAYYASVFTVSAQHRRRGIGRWLLEGINQVVFEERNADLVFSTFEMTGSIAADGTVVGKDSVSVWDLE